MQLVKLNAEDFIVDVSSLPDNILSKDFFLNTKPPIPVIKVVRVRYRKLGKCRKMEGRESL